MKHIFLVLFACMLLVGVGCQKEPNVVPPPQVAPPKAESPPPIPQDMPKPPASPSNAYLRGYRDGYAGNWLAPIRWTFADEYRNGWQAGAYDRQHRLPNRYP